MSLWNIYAGTFTKEFATEVGRLRASSDSWARDWIGGGTATSGWESKQAAAAAALKENPYSQGIEQFRFNDVDGALEHVGSVAGDMVNPQNVVLHPTLPVVYAAEWASPARLIAFAIQPDGTLERRSTVETLGEMAVAVSVHPSGNFAYVAHWGDGTLTACRLDGDGMVVGAEVLRRSEPEQISRHHHVRATPTGNGLLVTDIARDELTVYGADADGDVSPAPLSRIEFPSRSGPRHIEFDPSGKFVYVSDERASMVHVLEAEEWIPTRRLGGYSTVPSGYQGDNRPSELHLHPDGRTLYVGNRGFDSVTIFSVDGSGGLETLGYQPSLGERPSSVRVDPTGQYLIVGNVKSGSFVIFRIGEDRQLHPIGPPIMAPAPRSFVFVKASM